MALYTKLDVVNRGLSLLGQLPVNEVDTPHPAVPSILAHLELANKSVQSAKWWFNYETSTLYPQPDTNRIVVPDDIASIDACDKFTPVSLRGRNLYNHTTGTYEFDAPVPVYLHRVVPFEELPPTAARLVMIQALISLQAGLDGDGTRYNDLANEYRSALNAATAENTRNSQTNLLHRRGVQLGLYRINQDTAYQFRR